MKEEDRRGRDTRETRQRGKENEGEKRVERERVAIRRVVCAGSSGVFLFFFKEILTISRYCSQGETPRGENEPRRRRGAPHWPRLNRNSPEPRDAEETRNAWIFAEKPVSAAS